MTWTSPNALTHVGTAPGIEATVYEVLGPDGALWRVERNGVWYDVRQVGESVQAARETVAGRLR